ncbi:hypothetical protein [Fuerstiella marisgermanici]|uniref:Uncharacterized protein n=1 Tax=Fuerstiella marisgermanici TaxID=1891926 RepID=A0A1P8WIQ8_9PLAN|nr:hypothetical protein [Fuerstiella marisgermanici]APZ93949.1 hypothetical protein Fuma_03567 [Fuerstiella marisgermanici]
MIQSRTQDVDMLFAQEPVKDRSSRHTSSHREGANTGGGLNRLTPKTGLSAEKRRRRLERIRSNIVAERAEQAVVQLTVTELAASAKTNHSSASDKPAGKTDATTAPRFSEADFKPAYLESSRSSKDRDAKRRASRKTSAARHAPAAVATDFAAFEVSTKTERKKTASGDGRVVASKSLTSAAVGDFQVIDPPPPEPETYREWFKRVVANHRWTTWFTTFYVHWLLFLLMAAIVVHGPENAVSLLIDATFAETVETEVATFEVVSPEPELQPEAEPESMPEEEPDVTEMEEEKLELNPDLVSEVATDPPPESSSSASSSNDSAAKQSAAASAFGDYNPAPPSAVSEGSFSVWTEPSTPKAGEPYRIIIQVRLPKNIQRYDLSDLQGVVVGSDGYRKPIPGSMQGALPINNGYARFVVPIVSADATVRDTVFIRSRTLKETQKLVLQF